MNLNREMKLMKGVVVVVVGGMQNSNLTVFIISRCHARCISFKPLKQPNNSLLIAVEIILEQSYGY